MVQSREGDQFRPPGLNRTMEHGNWFLHHNNEFAGDVLIRHKEDDHLQVKIPFEALKELVAEASRKARLDRLYEESRGEAEFEANAKLIRELTVNQLLMLE